MGLGRLLRASFVVHDSWQNWFMVQGNTGSGFMITSNQYMAYEKKEYKKRIEGCHNL